MKEIGMTESIVDNLNLLKAKEKELLDQLKAILHAIHILEVHIPAAEKKPMTAESDDESGSFMKQVLAELGVQFTSVDIFTKAKELKPGLNRLALEKAVGQLQRTGAIQKIKRGRGLQPARFQKAFR